MATQNSINSAEAAKRTIEHAYDMLFERNERAVALVIAIQAQLPNDLSRDHGDSTCTTAHLLGILEDLLGDIAPLQEAKRMLDAAVREVQYG